MADKNERTKPMEVAISAVIAGSVIAWILSAVAMYQRNETAIIWTVYPALALTLLVPALTWQRRVWERPPRLPKANCLTVKDVKIMEARQNSAGTAVIVSDKSGVVLKPNMLVVVEVSIENKNEQVIYGAKPTFFYGVLDSILSEHPVYRGNPTTPYQSSQDVAANGGFFALSGTAIRIMPSQVIDIAAGRQFLSAYGFVDYRDGNIMRKLKFHYIYSPAGLDMVAGPTHNSTGCEDAN